MKMGVIPESKLWQLPKFKKGKGINLNLFLGINGVWMSEWMGECEAKCNALLWPLGLWKRYINPVHLLISSKNMGNLYVSSHVSIYIMSSSK